MRKPGLIIILALQMLIISGGLWAGEDPGVPDTLIVHGAELVVGQSRPITISITNDFPLGGFAGGFALKTLDGGFAQFDSVVYLNRMADPSVLQYRNIQYVENNNVSPDTLRFAAVITGPNSNDLPAGNGPVVDLYFTGLSTGTMEFDPCYIRPSSRFLFVTELGYVYIPQFAVNPITIVEGQALPYIILQQGPLRKTVDDNIIVDVEAGSPIGSPVTLELANMAAYDDETVKPINPPIFGPGNPAVFSWAPDQGDIGIWKAEFEACDTSGGCRSRELIIQVVSGDEYLISFNLSETFGLNHSTGIKHGNFDDDDNPELFSSGLAEPGLESNLLFDYTSQGILEKVFGNSYYEGSDGLELAYLNNDDFLDAVMLSYHHVPPNILILHGDGDNNLNVFNDAVTGFVTRGSAFGSFVGDMHLDYASVWQGHVRIYAGNSQGLFNHTNSISIGNEATTLNSGDFDGDGFDDFAVGTVDGIEIYMNDGDNTFSMTEFHSQEYGAVDIEVTNQGSDFNDDDIYDLCISTPSVGGAFSELVVYLGAGDGTFAKKATRTVKGQIFGNCVGDFNDDGILDIALVNGAHKYLAVLFGDGDGHFTNELRFDVPRHSPCFIDCFDVDLDGDLDIAVASNGSFREHSLFLFKNKIDPQGYNRAALNIRAHDNANIELVSTNGRACSRVKSTISGGDFYSRSLNYNGIIDEYITATTVEEGEYTLRAYPKPNLQPGLPFSLEFSLDGELYRLARGIPMNPSGYVFTICPGPTAEVVPRPGKFTWTNPPTFYWPGEGRFNFQLAADIDFSELIVDVTVTANNFTPEEVLPVTDTATFYWRVKQADIKDYGCLYAVNVVTETPTDTDDDQQLSPDNDMRFDLSQNYPNPFNPATKIVYNLPKQSYVSITIYNMLGQRIKTLVDDIKAAGNYTVVWDGCDENSNPVASGAYFYRIRSDTYIETRKMLLLR